MNSRKKMTGKTFKSAVVAAGVLGALALHSAPGWAAPGDNDRGDNRGVFGSGLGSRADFNTTVRGTINRFGGNRAEDLGVFELRAENGDVVRVLIGGDTRFVTGLSNFRNGARVEVEGLRDGDALLARDVRFEDNGAFVSILRGTVQDTPRSDRFTLALNAGANTTTTTSTRTVTVVDRNNDVRSFRRFRAGDQVEVHGTWQNTGRWTDGRIFRADSVTNTGISAGNNGDYLSGRFSTVRGRVTNDSTDASFTIDPGNGRLLTVRAANNIRVRRNDMVEVQGRYNAVDQIFRADSVTFVTGTGVGTTTGTTVDFPATVLDVRTSTRLTVKGDNGRTYDVTTGVALDRRISNGDRVRVVGTSEGNGVVRADQVSIQDNVSNGDARVDFNGTVTDVTARANRTEYGVRDANGRDYRVRYDGTTTLRVGDRVRVRGAFNDNNVVIADSVDRL